MAAALLLSHRSSFTTDWSAALQQVGLAVRTIGPADAPSALTPGSVLVVDGESHEFGQAEILSCLGLARARGGLPVVVLCQRLLELEDVLIELCAGLVAREGDERERVASAIRRRTDPARSARLTHLGGIDEAELVAILGDGTAITCRRPLSEHDSGASLVAVTLAEEGRVAQLSLADGSTIELSAAQLAQSRVERSDAPPLGDIDGVRLGQRLRALRIAAGLTQAELARRTGIHRPNIARVEAGRHTPSLETLARLASAIGVATTRVLAD